MGLDSDFDISNNTVDSRQAKKATHLESTETW